MEYPAEPVGPFGGQGPVVDVFAFDFANSPQGGPPFAQSDFDKDGDVDGVDLGVISSSFGKNFTIFLGDFDNDGVIDDDDRDEFFALQGNDPLGDFNFDGVIDQDDTDFFDDNLLGLVAS